MKKIYLVVSLRKGFDFACEEYVRNEAEYQILYINRVATTRKVADRSFKMMKEVDALNPAILVYNEHGHLIDIIY